jgi:hypothetical protein
MWLANLALSTLFVGASLLAKAILTMTIAVMPSTAFASKRIAARPAPTGNEVAGLFILTKHAFL